MRTPKKVIRSQSRNDCAVARFPNGRPGHGPPRWHSPTSTRRRGKIWCSGLPPRSVRVTNERAPLPAAWATASGDRNAQTGNSFAEGSASLCGDRAVRAIGAALAVAVVIILAGLAWLWLFGN